MTRRPFVRLPTDSRPMLDILRGGLGISDRGVSGFLPVQNGNRRTEIHEETKTQSLAGVQGASGPGGDPG